MRLPSCTGLGARKASFSQGRELPKVPLQDTALEPSEAVYHGSMSVYHGGSIRGCCLPDTLPLATESPGQASESAGLGGWEGRPTE